MCKYGGQVRGKEKWNSLSIMEIELETQGRRRIACCEEAALPTEAMVKSMLLLWHMSGSMA